MQTIADRVIMRDGVALRTLVCREQGDPARVAPSLLTRTAYGVDGILIGPEPLAFVKAGYVVVVQACRGTGGSEGIWDPLACEVEDGVDTIEWIRNQSWCNGLVGTFGASYGASTQLLALLGGARIDAAVPATSTADFHEARFDSGGPFRLSFNVGWAAQVATQRMRREGLSEPVLDPLVDDMDFVQVIRNGEWDAAKARVAKRLEPLLSHRPLAGLTAFDRLAPWFREWLGDERGELPQWRRLAPRDHYDRLGVPALHVAGWFDSNLEGTIENYRGMTAQAPQRLVLGPWRHWSTTQTKLGEVDYGPASARSMADLSRDWFDEHLLGRSSTAAPVEIFVMGRNEWRTELEWPPARAVPVRAFLASRGRAAEITDDGQLLAAPRANDPVDHFVYDPANPVPTHGGRLFPLGEEAGPFDQRRVEARPDVVVYTGPPLPHDVEVTGLVTAEIWLATTAVDTDVTAKLVDVYPDGRAMNVIDGIARARTKFGSGVQPGRAYPYRIRLGHTSQVFLAGHCIRVEVSSSCAPQYEPNPNTGQTTGTFGDEDVRQAEQRVLHDVQHASHVLLPVVGPRPW